MKDNRLRLPKWLRLTLLLAFMGLLVFCLLYLLGKLR